MIATINMLGTHIMREIVQSLHRSNPFSYLLSLEQEVRLHAPGLPHQEVNSKEWIAILFLSGNHVFLTPLDEVEEILLTQILSPIPGVKHWLRGIATTRGELFPVTDLIGFLTGNNSRITEQSRIMVVRVQEECSGILVDKVLGLQRIPEVSLKKELSEKVPEFEPFIEGVFFNEHIELPILKFKAIVQHPRFRDVTIKEEEAVKEEK